MTNYSVETAQLHKEFAARENDLRLDSGGNLQGINVLIVTSGHDVTDSRIFSKQACSLKKLGADVTVVGKLDGKKPDDIKVLSVPKPLSRMTRFLWQPWRCLWTARHMRPDIIHFHDAEMLMTLPLAKLWWRHSKFVYDVHEDYANLMMVRDWLPRQVKPIVRILINILEKGLALLADAIVGVTPPLADKFRNKERVVAYNYVAESFFHQTTKMSREPKVREFDVVHLGTLNLKRASFLADALKELHRLQPSARSLVIGVPPEIEKEMRKSLPDSCVVLGKVPYQDIPELLGNAKVGLDVHPWLGPHLEVAIPVKVCEYMAAGCAVVSSYMPVLQQVLDEAGLGSEEIGIIDGGTPIDYARTILQFVKMIDRGANPGAKLRASAIKHMVWEKEADKLERLYRRLQANRALANHQR